MTSFFQSTRHLMDNCQVIKAAERAHLWPELVFLYIKYDEFVSYMRQLSYFYVPDDPSGQRGISHD